MDETTGYSYNERLKALKYFNTDTFGLCGRNWEKQTGLKGYQMPTLSDAYNAASLLVQYSEWLNSITTFCAYYDLARAAANIKYMQDIRSDLLSFTGDTGNIGSVFDDIKATQPNYPGSEIPKSFEMQLPNGQKVWVHGNATEHFAEFAQSKALNYTPEAVRLATQEQLRSLQAAVNAATNNGIIYNEIINFGGWELKFAPPSAPGLLPALIHALFGG